MRDLHWYEIAVCALAILVIAPMFALALLPLGLSGAPMFLGLIVPALALSTGNG